MPGSVSRQRRRGSGAEVHVIRSRAGSTAISSDTGVGDTPVAPFTGPLRTAVGGAATCVVNDQIAEAADPPAFFATTYQ